MLIRRGMSAVVPAGTPYFPLQGPLVPTIINTIAGREREGGRFGVTANPRFPRGMGTHAVLRGSRMRRRGMGDVTYCSNNPPSSSQTAYLAANNIAYSIVDCGGTPTPQGTNLGNQPVTSIANPNVAPASAPVYQAPTDIEDCVALGLASGAGQACVARNTARAVAAENAHIANNQQYQTELCIANGGGGWVPVGQDVGSWCAGNYGGSVPASYAPILSVGPSAAPIPSLPAVSVQVQPNAVVPAGSAVQFSFQNLIGGNPALFKVGDQWRASITGAVPNAPVTVTGTFNGSTSTTPMGSTDASGNWSLAGLMDASTVGTWSEVWKVAGAVVAQVSFSVAAVSSVGSSAGSGSGTSPTTTGGGTVTPPTGTFDIGSFLTGSMFLGLPNWILLAAAAGTIILLGSHKR